MLGRIKIIKQTCDATAFGKSIFRIRDFFGKRRHLGVQCRAYISYGNVLNIWSTTTTVPPGSILFCHFTLLNHIQDRQIDYTLFMDFRRCIWSWIYPMLNVMFFLHSSLLFNCTFTLFDQDFSSAAAANPLSSNNKPERNEKKESSAFILIFSSELFFSHVNFRSIFSSFYHFFPSLLRKQRERESLVMILICGCTLSSLHVLSSDFVFFWLWLWLTITSVRHHL